MSTAKPPQTVVYHWGLRCPDCGSDAQIDIQLTTWARLHCDGTEPYGDHHWDEDSPTQCCACRAFGTVDSFTIKSSQA